jgi:DNA-binding transcriptional ArsR family regulator
MPGSLSAGGSIYGLLRGPGKRQRGRVLPNCHIHIIISAFNDVFFLESFMLLTNAKNKLGLKAKLFRGFSDPSRLSILEALRDGPLTVNEIVAATELSQPNVSNHLSCLRDCGLVAAEQRGRHVAYQLSDKRVEELLSLAEVLLVDVARGVYECTQYALPDSPASPNEKQNDH